MSPDPLTPHEAAELQRRKRALRLEAEAAAADPDDLAEALRVRTEMDTLAAAWTDADNRPDGQQGAP